MTSAHAILIALSAIVLASCAARAPKERTEEAALAPPEKYTADTNPPGPVDRAWIARFKEAKLTSFADEAIANNNDLAAAAARVEAAQANAKLAGVEAKPTIDLALSGNRSRQNSIGFPIPGAGGVPSSLSNTFGTSLDLTWELDVWGRVRAGRSAAAGRLQAAESDYAAARLSLAAQVAKSWFALTEARQQLALARETQTSFQNTEDVIRERFETGQAGASGTGAQLRLAMSDTDTAKASVEQRREQLDAALRQLEILLGRYPAGTLESSATLPRLPSAPPAGIPSELLRRRPDIVAAERRFAAAGAAHKQAILDYFPRFALTSRYGTSTGELGDILDSDFDVWSIAGNLAQPLLSAGRLTGNKRLRKAEEKESLANLRQTILTSFSEVEIALAAEDYLRRREAALEEATDLATEADSEARNEYRDGVGDILTVLAAQTQLLNLRSQLITVRRLRLDNRINLHLALGGDFRVHETASNDS